MKITSLKDIQELKQMVRVMDSTYDLSKEPKEMIGLNFEVKICYSDGTIGVYNKNKSHLWAFNKSDLQPLTPVEYKKRLVGEGDMVLYDGVWHEVYGYHWCDNEFVLETAVEKDYSDCWNIRANEIQDIKPLYTPKPQEIIEHEGYRYQLIKE
jgi:hypothetical protein